MDINGLVVVRLPHLNYLLPKRDVVPFVKDVYYSGLDRQRWADVFDEDFYTKKSPAEVNRIASAVRADGNDFTGIELCRDAVDASKLLAYSNRRSVDNELIAIRSPSLVPIKGSIRTNLAVEWIGFDFFAMGEWSLIAGGMFMYPGHYSAWLARINCFGLFDNSSLLTEYALVYEQAVAAGRSEPLAPRSSGFKQIAIEIGRVQPRR
jgi:hypothetical protein